MIAANDKNDKKVTVVVPCYNMEKKISRLLKSLLCQTYKCFKIYVIDDGSKDNSKDVVESFIDSFQKVGVPLNYIHQENGGVSAAVNNGLKKVDTDYFCIPDADDFLEPTYLEECVDYLSANLDAGIVFTQCSVYHQDFLNRKVGLLQRKDHYKCEKYTIFEDFIWGRNVYYCPDYMIRTEYFRKANGSMEIESGRYGQNYQLLLPITYYTTTGYIEKPLYNYIVYKQSISHGKRTLTQEFNSFDGGTKSLHETIHNMKMPEDKAIYYHHIIDQKNAIQKAQLAYEYGDKALFEEIYKTIEEAFLTNDMEEMYKKRNNPLYFKLYGFKKRTRKSIIASPLTYRIKSFLFSVTR